MSLRARLRDRKVPSAEFPLRIEDTTGPEAELREAQTELAAAQAYAEDDPQLLEAAQRRATAAEQALDACYEVLHIRAIRPSDWEALVAAHPPTEQQMKADNMAQFNIDTFRPALFAACIDGDETEDDWAEMTTKGELTIGEVSDLWWTVQGVNARAPDVRMGKGSPQTPS